MNVQELKEFREKLKHAKALCSWQGYNRNILMAFVDAELQHKCMITHQDGVMPNDVYIWYVNPTRAPTERKAMWDNSIAAVDAQIAKAK